VASASDERAEPYVDALARAGVPHDSIQVVVPGSLVDPASAAHDAAGLVLSGGVDVEPTRYGEVTLPEAGVETNPERDAFEWQLLTGARSGHTATFAVCRGMQVVNVFCGGSLWQDLPSQRPSAIEHSVNEPVDHLEHKVRVNDIEHPLAALLRGGDCVVNSRHHQAVKDLAPGLLPIAQSDDGLIEALAAPATDPWWVAAVQWHPENLTALRLQLDLWKHFVAAVQLAAVRPQVAR
jgi:putative glutamine amidotransferase